MENSFVVAEPTAIHTSASHRPRLKVWLGLIFALAVIIAIVFVGSRLLAASAEPQAAPVLPAVVVSTPLIPLTTQTEIEGSLIS